MAYGFSSDGWAVVKKSGYYGYIDITGAYVIEPQFGTAESFTDNGLACVSISSTYGYIDETGSFVIEAQYIYAGYFSSNGLAPVCEGDLNSWGFINSEGVLVIPYQFYTSAIFNTLKFFDDGYCVAYSSYSAFSIIDEDGIYIFNHKFTQIVSPLYG